MSFPTQRKKGQSLVELALVFLALLLLFAGAIDLGRLFFSFMAVRDAAQEGAVFASLYPNDPTAIANRVIRSSKNPIDFSSSSVTIASGASCSAKKTWVWIRYKFEAIAPLMSAIVGPSGFPLCSLVTETVLTSDCTAPEKIPPAPSDCRFDYVP